MARVDGATVGGASLVLSVAAAVAPTRRRVGGVDGRACAAPARVSDPSWHLVDGHESRLYASKSDVCDDELAILTTPEVFERGD